MQQLRRGASAIPACSGGAWTLLALIVPLNQPDYNQSERLSLTKHSQLFILHAKDLPASL
jgi:hypothetical protein